MYVDMFMTGKFKVYIDYFNEVREPSNPWVIIKAISIPNAQVTCLKARPYTLLLSTFET